MNLSTLTTYILRLFFVVICVCTNYCLSFKISIPSNESNQIQVDKIRIIGGKTVNIEDYNYQVSVKFRGSHICGGVIIDERTIISAAHCFFYLMNFLNLIEIQAGSSFLNNRQGGENDEDIVNSKIEKIIIHPDYSKPNYLENDIALLFLKKDLKFSHKIGSIDLPEMNESILSHTNVEVTGWGTVKSNTNILSNQLKAVEIKIVDYETCNKSNFFQVKKHNMICAGDSEGGKDSCAGDSGGPLLLKVKNKHILVGIVSWGFGCGNPSHPGVYTKVSTFVNWIKINSNTVL